MENQLMEVDEIIKEIRSSISINNHNSRSGLSYQRYQKYASTRTDDEVHKIRYLVDSHVPSLRERSAMRYERILMKEQCSESRIHLKMLKDIISTKCHSNDINGIDEFKRQIGEMPKEWTIIQLTSVYHPEEDENLDEKIYSTSGLHILVFNCGQNNTEPILVTVPPPSVGGNKFELLQDLMNAIEENNERLAWTAKRTSFKNLKEKYEYMLKREDTELMFKGIVKKAEENWLREWRCLLIGKYIDESVEQNIRRELEIIFRDQLSDITISQKSIELLHYITKGAAYLSHLEILKAVQYSLNDVTNPNVIKEISRLIKEVNIKIINSNEKIVRHPIILIIDEYLDGLPWEMMEILKGEAVSRVPSLHFAYLLFKTHEKDIEDGHKVIRNYENGKYILNPDGDLVQMGVRMSSFYDYWLPEWTGINDRRPTGDEFYECLKDAEIFSYNGHGNGTHIMTVEALQRINVRAVVLLFGCASTRITRLGTQVEMYGSYHMYLISRCPCVLGMLWPVTDLYTDILTAEFLSNWIPSTAPIPWENVDKNNWKKAVNCDFPSTESPVMDKINNLELLRALAHSKKVTDHYLTKAACVVRGLPVKIKLK